MAKKKEPPSFKSLAAEREFWQSHDVFEVLGEGDWEVVEAGDTQVQSFYIAPVGEHGAEVHIPLELLDRIGLKQGRKIRVHVEGKRLIIEAA